MSKTFGKTKNEGFLESIVSDYLVKPTMFDSWANLNIVVFFLIILAVIARFPLTYWYILPYALVIFVFYNWRNKKSEKDRLEIAHSIPFFADALANSLSVGLTLEQAFEKASYYLKGKIKSEFDELRTKHALGKGLRSLLRDLDVKFPHTGFSYLVSLIEEYRNLGVGISPPLKRIAEALQLKEEAEEKIRTVLASGNSYARLTIGLFSLIFLGMTFLLRDQVAMLAAPNLRPVLIYLLVWAALGTSFVSRVTSMDFAKNLSLRPEIKHYVSSRHLTIQQLMDFPGVELSRRQQTIFTYSSIIAGFVVSYVASWYSGDPITIMVFFALAVGIFWFFGKLILEGLVEDELIKTIEVFPEFLQVFVIGLNSGLNIYLSLQFAEDAIKVSAPKILTEALRRTRFAMESGEQQYETWNHLAEFLPFRTIIDFCDIMVVAPMQGESIVKTIIHMTSSYQIKKIAIIEKKAFSLSQLVIPLVVVSFFPLFLFAIFAPLLMQIGSVLNR